MTYSLLYVDDDPHESLVRQRVESGGFQVRTCRSAPELNTELALDPFPHHVCLVDYRLEQRFKPQYETGITVTQALLEKNPEIAVVGISKWLGPSVGPESGTVVGKWVLAGARWFCDWDSFGSATAFDRTLQIMIRCAERVAQLRVLMEPSHRLDLRQYSGLSETLETLDRIARLPAPVLLLGETGTGKELLASRIHDRSPRREGPFVVGNCANLRGELAEVMLHGQEFHHNDPRAPGFPKPGWFEQAHGGTLFLDEIGDLPPEAQASLLRVLSEKKVRRVLGDQWIDVDFRLVAATHKPLVKMAAAGEFRSDLFYRLEVFPIRVPPLSQRREDIPRLATYFGSKYSQLFGRQVQFSQEVLDYLSDRDYPGNVRELENLVQRVVGLTISERPSVDDAKRLDGLTIEPRAEDLVLPSPLTRQRYVEQLAAWMRAHLSQLGSSLDFRTKTAFVRAATVTVSEQHDPAVGLPKGSAYILRLIRDYDSDLYEAILSRSSGRRGARKVSC